MSEKNEAMAVVLNISPIEGWVLKRTPEVLQGVAEKLLAQGFDEDEAGDIITDVMNAIKKEYGN